MICRGLFYGMKDGVPGPNLSNFRLLVWPANEQRLLESILAQYVADLLHARFLPLGKADGQSHHEPF
jgi:hypothetical protein